MKHKMGVHPGIKVAFAIILAVIAIVLIGMILLTILEYRPKDNEVVDIQGEADEIISHEDELSILGWNIGYAGMGENEDFFMDGGKGIRPASSDIVEGYLTGIIETIGKYQSDIVLLQEVDKSSKRTYGIDETKKIAENMKGYESIFSHNFNSFYVPYPFPPIGRVEAGLLTFSRFNIDKATRFQLPIPFKWPVSTVNLKRCLQESRYKIENTDKELVIYNLHLEAFDDGEGKVAQTKMLADTINTERKKGNYVIAAGDFNQVFSGVDISMYPLQSGDVWSPGMIEESRIEGKWQFLMDNSVPTCRSADRAYDNKDVSFQYYMVDGFIVSDNVEVTNIRTIDCGFKDSDHNPTTLSFRFKY